MLTGLTQALGISIGGAIFSSEMDSSPSARREISSLDHHAVSPIQTRSVMGIFTMDMEARVAGLRKIWMFCLILCVVMLLASFGIKAFPIDTPKKKEEVCSAKEAEV
jgi:uncharacterized membrane protein